MTWPLVTALVAGTWIVRGAGAVMPGIALRFEARLQLLAPRT
ncbi:MAG: hypothetical protein QOE92_728, partial [Chloroflexota bacterium]|nr:hypothetical protein [Chloroflexota bacterium]